jgi:hypothetical protein
MKTEEDKYFHHSTGFCLSEFGVKCQGKVWNEVSINKAIANLENQTEK